jgi:rod shape-determining protein MreD
MASTPITRPLTQIWFYRTAFVLLATLLVFLSLLPLNTVPRSWAGPDILLCITFAWMVRRPDYLPAILVASVFLIMDFILQRPPGLWAALVFMASEVLRARSGRLRNSTILAEWGAVIGLIFAITLINRVTLSAVIADQAPMTLVLTQLIATFLAYPMVVGTSHFLFGVRKSAPGQVNSLGHRL